MIGLDQTVIDQICRDEDVALVKLWVLADNLCIAQLQNDVVDAITKIAAYHEEPPNSCTYQWIFNDENTATDSPLRRLIIRLNAAYMNGTDFLSHEESYPPRMLLDLLRYLGRCTPDLNKIRALGSIKTKCYVDLD
jgi:hypothetical protein